MGRPRDKQAQGETSEAVASEVAKPRSVPAASYDPADLSQNHNADQPAYASPKAVIRTFTQHYGDLKQQREGQVGEPRPMFGSSLKEY